MAVTDLAFALVLTVMTQMTTGQMIGNAYSIGNAIAANAANAATESAVLAANGMAYAPYAGCANQVLYPNQYINQYAYGAPRPIPYEEMPIVTGIPGITFGLSLTDLSASKGNGLRVLSSSPISPSGVTVQSDNMAVEGPLSVSGQLPFLGVVAVEGPLPALGQGAVAYGCGNGNVGMVNEGVNEPSLYANAAYANGPYVNGYAKPALGLNPAASCNGMPAAPVEKC